MQNRHSLGSIPNIPKKTFKFIKPFIPEVVVDTFKTENRNKHLKSLLQFISYLLILSNDKGLLTIFSENPKVPHTLHTLESV